MAMMGWSVFSCVGFYLTGYKKTQLDNFHFHTELNVSTQAHAPWRLGSINTDIFADVCVTACDVVSSRCQRGPSEYTETPGMWNTQSHWCGSASVKCLVFYFIFASFIFSSQLPCTIFPVDLLMYASVLFWSYTSDQWIAAHITTSFFINKPDRSFRREVLSHVEAVFAA